MAWQMVERADPARSGCPFAKKARWGQRTPPFQTTLRRARRLAVSGAGMNIHHLELFYYVARHGGISRAVRNMPYGIQQPAVSSQILLLEEDLGAKLFERQPFKLTREGEELYEFVRPFFDNLFPMAEKLRKQSAPSLRIGASELVLRDYLPTVIEQLRDRKSVV